MVPSPYENLSNLHNVASTVWTDAKPSSSRSPCIVLESPWLA
ncbi:MAG TPA: hypothetical protein VHG30_04735 [Microvirga sp.]|nr:hypothetical protein [Microvirga sp.]